MKHRNSLRSAKKRGGPGTFLVRRGKRVLVINKAYRRFNTVQ